MMAKCHAALPPLKSKLLSLDIIYMDAFLKPSEFTDATGVPLYLKTISFYKSFHEKLNEEGLVVFNINPHADVIKDLDAIREAFPQVYVFMVPSNGSLVIVGSLSKKRVSRSSLVAAGKAMDRKCNYGFSFEAMAKQLREQEKE